MTNQLPIAKLITKRQADLHITAGELIKRAGYRSTNGGLRRLSDLCGGDLSPRTRFLVDALPAALDLPAAEVQEAVQATLDQIAEVQRARAEAEDQAYRANFRPHVLWVTENSRPSSITMAAFYGIERLLRFDLDVEQGEANLRCSSPSRNAFNRFVLRQDQGILRELLPRQCRGVRCPRQ